MRMVVDFPAPLGPRKPWTSPARTKIAEMRDFMRFLEAELPRLLERYRQAQSAEATS
jgi:hypothetical protein